MAKRLKLIIGLVIGIFIFAVLLFVPIKSRVFSSVVKNKYEFFNRGVLTVDYYYDNLVYEKDVFVSLKTYSAYNIGDNYSLTIKESVLASIPETYIFSAAIVSVIAVSIIAMFTKSDKSHKLMEEGNGEKD